MYDQIIKLVSTTVTSTDDYGNPTDTIVLREVFAELSSIGQSEIYQAQAVGLKPEIKFKLADYYDYQGEKTLFFQDYCDIEPLEYSVIRTYRSGNGIEIVCKRGIN